MNRLLSEITRAGFGYGLTPKSEYNFNDKIVGFLALVRPILMILSPLNAAGAAVLGLGRFPLWTQCIIGFCAVAFANAGVTSFNDYTDRERDKHIWPSRSIPSGRVKPNKALYMVLVFFTASLSISWFFFNPLTFFILLLAIILGSFYSKFLRDKVGYLSLPPIVGLIYLGGWAAFSPETLFTSLLPWYLYVLGVIWQVAHIMVYYPLHIISADIDPVVGKSKLKVPPVLFFTPSPRIAVGIGTAFICLTLILSVLLVLVTPLGTFYLIPVVAAGIYALNRGIILLKDSLNKEKGLKAFASLSIFRLTISVSILLSVLLFHN